MMDSFKKNDSNLFKTLHRLKQSAKKLNEDNPPVEKLVVKEKQTEDPSFYSEFEACLSEFRVKNNVDRAQKRTVDIIDKVSIDEIMRKYNHDFGKYFRYTDKTKQTRHIQKTVKRILENTD